MLCKCGCGKETKYAGHKYIHGHNRRGKPSLNWKGGRTRNRGYVLVWKPDHPKAIRGYVPEQVIVAENLLGKPVPNNVVIHHYGKKDENDKLVICQDKIIIDYYTEERGAKHVVILIGGSVRTVEQYRHTENLASSTERAQPHHNGYERMFHMKCKLEYNKNHRSKDKAPKFIDEELDELINFKQ